MKKLFCLKLGSLKTGFLFSGGLVILFLPILFISRSSQGKQGSARTIQESAQPPIIKIRPQDGSPLQISTLQVDVTDPLNPSIKLMVLNSGDRPVQAFAIRHDDLTQTTRSSGVSISNAALPRGVLYPGQWKTETIDGVGYSKPVNQIILSVDFVEFEDGVTWGQDTYRSAERLAGNREGAEVATKYLTKIIETEGKDAFVGALEKLEIDPPSNQSSEWTEGFRGGIDAVRARLQQSRKEHGLDMIYWELKKPYDASGPRRQK
jgi:hypothetical protein